MERKLRTLDTLQKAQNKRELRDRLEQQANFENGSSTVKLSPHYLLTSHRLELDSSAPLVRPAV